MAKATTTIRQRLQYEEPEALTALEKLTHATKRNPHPVMPLAQIVEDMPAMFRRAAIHAALGAYRSFFAHHKKWQAKKEKAVARGKKFTERPPVPPRTWNKPATLYAGMWKDRKSQSLVLKVWTGTCWSWLKCRLTGRELPSGTKGSPSLVRRGGHWCLHTPVEKTFTSPAKIEKQVTTNKTTEVCQKLPGFEPARAECHKLKVALGGLQDGYSERKILGTSYFRELPCRPLRSGLYS
jgi:hypothetical protein